VTIRKVERDGKSRWVVDIPYKTADGKRLRYRRDALTDFTHNPLGVRAARNHTIAQHMFVGIVTERGFLALGNQDHLAAARIGRGGTTPNKQTNVNQREQFFHRHTSGNASSFKQKITFRIGRRKNSWR
jgi:hypothetical protein